MRSMTGYGLGVSALGDGRISIEIRSINHRFLDVRVRLPTELAEQTFFLEQLAREHLSRGRYDVGVRLEGAALPPPPLSLDRARSAYRSLAELRDQLAPGTELPITAILSLPHLLPSSASFEPEVARQALRAAFREALRSLEAMRATEGATLAIELAQRLVSMRTLATSIRAQSAEAVEAHRARLKTRLARLMSDVSAGLEPGRLEQEIALLADRTDITEELVRLESHFGQLETLFSDEEAVGRRLDFLLQEVAREVNTIGSKCQDSAVAHLAVELKSEVERMREQVQNVE